MDNVRGWLRGLLRRHDVANARHDSHLCSTRSTSWKLHLQCHHHMTVVPVEQLMFRVHMQRALTNDARSHNKSRGKTLEHVSRNLRQNSVRRCMEATHRKPQRNGAPLMAPPHVSHATSSFRIETYGKTKTRAPPNDTPLQQTRWALTRTHAQFAPPKNLGTDKSVKEKHRSRQ